MIQWSASILNLKCNSWMATTTTAVTNGNSRTSKNNEKQWNDCPLQFRMGTNIFKWLTTKGQTHTVTAKKIYFSRAAVQSTKRKKEDSFLNLFLHVFLFWNMSDIDVLTNKSQGRLQRCCFFHIWKNKIKIYSLWHEGFRTTCGSHLYKEILFFCTFFHPENRHSVQFCPHWI